MKKHHKGFFSYTRKERTGIIVLVCLIIATIVIPSFLPSPALEVDNATFEHLRTQLASLEREQPAGIDSGLAVSGHSVDHTGHQEPRVAALFTFDPNTLPVDGWERLGIRTRTAQTIRKYVSHGGKFRRAEDLYKIYTLPREEAERLMPYVAIPESEQAHVAGYVERNVAGSVGKPTIPYGTPIVGAGADSRFGRLSGDNKEASGKWRKRLPAAPVDINVADTSAFIALWGIGSKLAARIVNFRDKLGGFHRVEQVGETYGLPDSTFQAIRPLLVCASQELRTININTADAVLLDQHPYISRSQAYAIVRYREQHGAYQTVDQLLQINILTPDLVEKMRPYLSVR